MITKAIQVARRSTIRRHKTGAVITDSKGNVISVGWSHVPSYSLKDTPFSMHAEHHAILRAAQSKRSVRNGRIYIATIASKSGNVTSAKPCNVCAALLREVGIKEIIYTEREVLTR